MIWFTSDQHYNHENVIKFGDRPYKDIHEMNEALIDNHNKLVQPSDVVYNLGDFLWHGKPEPILKRLHGTQVFLRGNHDRWLNKKGPHIKEITVDGIPITLCHYCMRTWNRSHWGAWQLFGHSHGRLEEYDIEKQWDVGVDNNNYVPISMEELKQKLVTPKRREI